MRKLLTNLILVFAIIADMALSDTNLGASFVTPKSQSMAIYPYINWIKTNGSIDELYQIVPQGSMSGYMTYDNFWNLYEELHAEFPDIISQKKVFGKTYEKNEMHTFNIGHNIQDTNRYPRSKILFTALHHSREPTGQLALITTLLHAVQVLYSKDSQQKQTFKNIDFAIIPIVNVDSYKKINEKYFLGSNWENDKLKRLNMNDSYKKCPKWLDSGVDLNRNYPFKWGCDDEGSSPDPCHQDYRGPHAESEIEVQNMIKFVNNEPLIVSAMNFHAYGDLWVFPFNWDPSEGNEGLKSKPLLYNSYKHFMKFCPFEKHVAFGPGMETVKYTANGEASDWMLEKHNIMAFSPEVGSDSKDSDTFYVEKSKISEVIEKFYPTILCWIQNHKIKQENVQITNDANINQIDIVLRNVGYSNAHNSRIVMKLQTPLGVVVKNAFLNKAETNLEQNMLNFDNSIQTTMDITSIDVHKIENTMTVLSVANYKQLERRMFYVFSLKLNKALETKSNFRYTVQVYVGGEGVRSNDYSLVNNVTFNGTIA